MKPIRLPDLSPEAIQELDRLYRTTRVARLRTRAQIVLLAAEKQMNPAEIAGIVRSDEQTVRRWLKRYLALGADGLEDAPRPGGPRKATDAYRMQLIQLARQKPASLNLPYPRWTAERLADHMAEVTGITLNPETVRLHLKAEGIVLGRAHHPINDLVTPQMRRTREPGSRERPRKRNS